MKINILIILLMIAYSCHSQNMSKKNEQKAVDYFASKILLLDSNLANIIIFCVPQTSIKYTSLSTVYSCTRDKIDFKDVEKELNGEVELDTEIVNLDVPKQLNQKGGYNMTVYKAIDYKGMNYVGIRIFKDRNTVGTDYIISINNEGKVVKWCSIFFEM